MAFAQRTFPDHFLADDWDEAWARGWFRMRQNLFTTHFLEFDRKFHAALWLRVRLSDLVPDKKFLELKKFNRGFRAEFRTVDPVPSRKHEELYRIYRQSLTFEPALNLRDLLLGGDSRSVFPTWQVELYDGETLIAAGFFDGGKRAAAGISCFYNPAYHKHSLGKYLIYLKMEFCQNQGLELFYPGYLAPGEPRFDYKRHIGAATLEYLELSSGLWRPYPTAEPVPDPLEEMIARLTELQSMMDHGLAPKLRRYLHLDINLNPQIQGLGLFDFPVFLDCFPEEGASPVLVVVWDPRNGLYQLLHCKSVYRFEGGEKDEDVFESDLLLVERSLYASPLPEELGACLIGFTVAGRA